MKLKKLSASILAAAVAAGVIAPLGALAATEPPAETPGETADPYTSGGSIHYTQAENGGDTGDVTDPEEGENIDNPTPNPSTGKLMIIGATDLTFTNAAGLTAGTPYGVDLSDAEQTYYAVPFQASQTPAEGGEATTWTTPHFVEFRDVRADASYFTNRNYQITAKITQAFTGTNGQVINGAKIDYSGLAVQGQRNVFDGDGNPTGSTYSLGTVDTDYVLAPSINLNQGVDNDLSGAAVNVLSVHSGSENTSVPEGSTGTDGAGQGRFHILFGNNTTNTAVDENVSLTVPAGQTLSTGEYNAQITWSIQDTI